MEKEKIKPSELLTDLKDEPFKTIINWSEERFKLVGRRVFPILSLMPHSTIIPPIPYTDMPIRSNIHCLFLSPPGGAKSQISSTFAELTYNPLKMKSFTSAAAENQLMQYQNQVVTLIVDDMATVAHDPTLLKTLEGALGEEKEVSRVTANKRRQFDVNMTALFCGVPNDLTHYLTSGFIFRVSPILVVHNKEEQDEIGERIVNSIGYNTKPQGMAGVSDIKRFYSYLAQIQGGEGHIQPIRGYDFSQIDKTEIYRRWKDIRERVKTETRYNWYRELFSGFRYMASYSFLNIFNRQVKQIDGQNYLILEDEDLGFAMKLMAQEISMKQKILKANDAIGKAENIKELLAAIEGDKSMDAFFKEVIKLMATIKNE